MRIRRHPERLRSLIWSAPALALLIAGCGAAAPKPPSSSPTPPASAAGVTIKLARVGGLGQVLVNSQGRTLYTLSSEHGGQLTCTVSSGCLQYWPELDLASGASSAHVGGGVSTAMLGTVAGANQGRLVTYGGWPLYTYSGDSAPGQSKGEGLKSFGGTWWAVGASGLPVKASGAASTPTPSSGGYSY